MLEAADGSHVDILLAPQSYGGIYWIQGPISVRMTSSGSATLKTPTQPRRWVWR